MRYSISLDNISFSIKGYPRYNIISRNKNRLLKCRLFSLATGCYTTFSSWFVILMWSFRFLKSWVSLESLLSHSSKFWKISSLWRRSRFRIIRYLFCQLFLRCHKHVLPSKIYINTNTTEPLDSLLCYFTTTPS